MSIRSLKLSFNGEIRRFSLESLKVVEGKVTLADLKQVVRETFVELEKKEFILSYKDEDEDVITISTDVEVNEAFNGKVYFIICFCKIIILIYFLTFIFVVAHLQL